MKPLAIDLFCGLGGWTEGLLAAGYRVVGFDIERHEYGEDRYPAQLVLQDATTLHGSQFRDAALIVASPPCQEYSYMSMPWTKAKDKAKAIRADDSGAALEKLNRLFNACFRIQREACEAAGRHIPLVVENVRGAQAWVGRARWNYGSFYLWGDVPALMPVAQRAGVKVPGMDWNNHDKPGYKAVAFNDSRHTSGTKRAGGSKVVDGHKRISEAWRSNAGDTNANMFGTKRPGIGGQRKNGKGDAWFQDGAARHGSKSAARKAASARIAKIPIALSQHVAEAWRDAR